MPTRTSTTTPDQTIPEPPAEAVSRDSHWSAKMTRLRNRKPTTIDLLFADGEAADELADAQRALTQARRQARAELRAEHQHDESFEVTDDMVESHELVTMAADGVTAALTAQQEADVTVHLRSLPADVYEALLAAHPPTEEQAGQGMTYNVTRFAPALVAAWTMRIRGRSAEDAPFARPAGSLSAMRQSPKSRAGLSAA